MNARPNVTPRSAAESAMNWPGLEERMHRDPGSRGLASFRRDGAALDAGSLRAAAVHLAQHARRVAIVTGFCVQLDDRVTAETDGPPGALFLARVLSESGIDATIITDRCAVEILRAGAEWMRLPDHMVREFPFDTHAGHATSDAWMDAFFAEHSPAPWTHLIAIERPGPSHTLESFLAQRRDVAVAAETFLAAVPELDRDRCHTMLGEVIDEHTAPTHRLLERIAERPLPIMTIGIGDGGNELGMGRFLWEDLVAAIATGPAGRIACRISTDETLLAGTSNWGAYALALAVARLRGVAIDHHPLTPQGQQELLRVLVSAGAVDGRTRRAEPTVDGLMQEDYATALAEMLSLINRRSVGQ